MLLILTTFAYSQVTVTSSDSINCTNLCTTLTANISGAIPTDAGIVVDDYYSGILPIGFTFNFYGNNYTNLLMGPNGTVCFNTALANAYTSWTINAVLLGNTTVKNSICGPWCDIDITNGGTMTYSLSGTAPYRKYTITFCGDNMFFCTTQKTSSQIILYETTNVVEVHITSKPLCTTWNGGYAIVGVQNAAGTAATAAPGRNYPLTYTCSNEAWRFTPNVGLTSYSVTSIPYAPVPYTTSTIYWYNATTNAFLGTGTTINVCPTTTTTYKAGALGCSDTSFGYYTVVPSGPVAPVTGPTAVCMGQTATLSDATAGGVWSSSNTGIATINASTGVITSVSAGTVTITYTAAGCNRTYTFTVNPKPTAPTTTPQTFCQGTAAGVLSAAGTNLTWYGPGVTGGYTTAPTPSTTTAGTATYYVTQTSAAGCISDSTAILVTVNPSAPVNGVNNICQGGSTTLSNANAGGIWSSSNTAVATIDATTGVVTGVSGGTITITYTLSGCPSTFTFTVNPKPTAPAVTPQSYCQFDAAIPVLATGTNILWYGPGVTAGMSTAPTPSTASAGSITYYATQTTATGCVSDSAIDVVTINPKPTPPVVLLQSYCQNTTALPVSATGTDLIWYGPGVTTSMPTAPTPSTTTAGTVTYYVTQTTLAGCISDSAVDNIIINPVTPITGLSSICLGFSTTLSNATTGGTWSSSNTAIASIDATTGIINGTTAGTVTVTYTVGGCSTNFSFTVNPKPSAPIVTPQNYCQFATAVPVAATGINLTWYGPGITTGMTTAPTPSTTTIGNITYYVTQTSAEGCISDSATDIVIIDIKPAAPVVTPQSYCQNTTAVPVAASGINLTWYGPSVTTGMTTAPTPSTATAGTITYYVTQTTAAGCASDSSLDAVVINPIATISGVSSICFGQTATLTDAVTGGIWSSSNTAIVSIDATTGGITALTTGTVTITYTDGPCYSTQNFTVNPKPAPPVVTPQSYCQNATSVPVTATGINLTWYGPGVTTGMTTAPTPSTATAGTITYYVTQTTAAGCVSDSSTDVVTINPIASITGLASVCFAHSVTLADAATGGTWSSSNTAIASVNASTGVVTGLSAGVATITYTLGSCYSTLSFTVNPKPTAPVITPQSYCQWATAVPVAATGINLTWYGPGVTAGMTVAPTPVTTSAGTITYYVTQTSTAGCVSDSSVDAIIVNPINLITGVNNVCPGKSTTLYNTSTGGSWSSSSPAIASINSATGLVTGHTAGVTTITYTLGSCSVTYPFTVNPTPAPPTVITQTYCQFSSAIAVAAVGSNLLWYGPGTTAALSIAPTPSTNTPGNITYYVTQTSTAGCVSDSATDVVTIIVKPSAPLTYDTSYCQDFSSPAPITVQVSGTTGILNWYTSASTPLTGAPTIQTSVYNYPTGSYWLVSQTVNGCESDKTPIKVTILPTPKFTLNYRTVICNEDSVSITPVIDSGSVFVSAAYSWTIPATGYLINGTTLSSSIINIKFDTIHPVYNTGSVTIGNFNGECSTTETFTIKTVSFPISEAYINQEICLGDTVGLALTAHSNNAYSYIWLVDGVSMSTSPVLNVVTHNENTGGPYRVSFNDTGIHILSLTTVTIDGCSSVPWLDTVRVHSLPEATFTIHPLRSGALCLEDSILFVADYENPAYSYLWEPTHFFNNNNKPSIWGQIEQMQSQVTLTVTDPFGCKGIGVLDINPDACCLVSFPNAFTPNGDGKNDYFRPIFTGHHKFHVFRIMNRFGQTVFETNDSYPQWDGKFNGEPQDMGTFYYYIKYDCGGSTLEQKGDCTLVR